MDITLDLEKYITEHTTAENEVLSELNRQTHLQMLMPRMLSGHLQGKLLEFLSKMLRPKRILELGTFTGYSAICLAQGLAEDGKLITIEKNDEVETFAKSFFEKAGLDGKVEMLVGDATQIIPTLNEKWDLVFMDADKPNYPFYYDLVIDYMNPNGWIIADNVLWDGKVTDDPSTFDQYTTGIVELNKKIQDDPRVENMLLPFRDGLMIARKL